MSSTALDQDRKRERELHVEECGEEIRGERETELCAEECGKNVINRTADVLTSICFFK